MARVRIVAQSSGTGLRKDMALLGALLEGAGHTVDKVNLIPPSREVYKWLNFYERARKKYFPASLNKLLSWFRIKLLARRDGRADINIFLEILFPEFIGSARHNVLVPNQEWFKPELVSYLPWIDIVLCKTWEADRVFSSLGCKTRYVSFTSVDSFCPKISKDYSRALHFAGNGLTKGTNAVINVWSKHPEWPVLWISQKDHLAKQATAPNIRYFDRFLEEAELPRLQTESGFYIGPSEAEGFGHALVEAMSAKTLVVTTDAPPMNEVVTKDRGFLAKAYSSSPKRLGTSYYVHEEALEDAIAAALSLSAEERKKLSDNARQWYLENDKFFREAFLASLSALH